MALSEELFREVKEKVEKAKQEYERAKGAIKQLMTELKEEYGCETEEEAEELFAKLKKELKELEAELEKMIQEYQEKWMS